MPDSLRRESSRGPSYALGRFPNRQVPRLRRVVRIPFHLPVCGELLIFHRNQQFATHSLFLGGKPGYPCQRFRTTKLLREGLYTVSDALSKRNLKGCSRSTDFQHPTAGGSPRTKRHLPF